MHAVRKPVTCASATLPPSTVARKMEPGSITARLHRRVPMRPRTMPSEATTHRMPEETNDDETVQAGGPCVVEFRGRARARKGHARRHVAHAIQGLHGTGEQRRATIRDQERHHGPCRDAQGIRADKARELIPRFTVDDLPQLVLSSAAS